MRTATITLREADFAREMIEMRTWLDQHFCEPARFTYEQDREIVVISVDFQEMTKRKPSRAALLAGGLKRISQFGVRMSR